MSTVNNEYAKNLSEQESSKQESCCATTCCSEENTNLDVKEEVRRKYAEIAKAESESCGSSSCCSDDITYMSDDYKNIDGYVPEADLGLGCGIPVEDDMIKEGSVVVDLGSGAGNDAFIASSRVGNIGKVVGIDFTDEMILKANKNKDKLGFRNVEFRKGDIENIPLDDNFADLIISNCVINLVPDKKAAFSEIHRIMKQGGKFSISDIVLKKELPEKFAKVVSFYTGCIAGAILESDYYNMLKETGFKNIEIVKEKYYQLNGSNVNKFLNDVTEEEINSVSNSIKSVTIRGEK